VDKTVWVDDWQMQCCGQPFTVGTTVSWTLREADPDWLIAVLGPDVASTVDAAEEHHSDAARDTPTTTGTVGSIQAVHCRYGPQPGGDPRMHYPISGSGVITDVRSADGWTPDQGELRFAGYLVRLEVPS
jgi:hypothetical protein